MNMRVANVHCTESIFFSLLIKIVAPKPTALLKGCLGNLIFTWIQLLWLSQASPFLPP